MSKNYKTYKKEKWLFFILSILAYFVPYIVVTAVFFSFMDVAAGYKAAVGIVIVALNAVPFLMGLFRTFFAHFPMFNVLAVVFCIIAMFFTVDFFQSYVDKFIWIEFAAAVGSIISCILWHFYRKYSRWAESIKANVKSGAFTMKNTDTGNNE